MLTQIDVESENAFFVPVINATPKDSLLIRKVTGLTPPDIDLFLGEYSRDGGFYQGRRVGKRNVVLTLDLNPNPALGETISGLREMLYKAFLDPLVGAKHVKLNLHGDDGRVRYLVGYTEKFEGEVFDVETLVQISLVCTDPYIRDNEETVLAKIPGWTTVPFSYQGSAETGFQTTVYINTATSVLTLENNGEKMVIDRDFSVGDLVTISTIRGQRYMTVKTPGGLESSIVASLSPLSPWLELHSQSNLMRVYGEIVGDFAATIQELRYTQSYWGV